MSYEPICDREANKRMLAEIPVNTFLVVVMLPEHVAPHLRDRSDAPKEPFIVVVQKQPDGSAVPQMAMPFEAAKQLSADLLAAIADFESRGVYETST